jgi:hypothetical protein
MSDIIINFKMAKLNLFKSCIMVFLVIAMLPLISSVASANNCTSLIYNGPSEYKHDIVIVGSNYTEAQLYDFFLDVNASAYYMLNMTPYKNYSKMFNVWYVNQSANLGCVYDGSSMWACSTSAALALASQCPMDGNKRIVLVNDHRYGGSATTEQADCDTGGYMKTCVAHEYGHAFGELMDEYNSGFTSGLWLSGANCALPEEANFTVNTTACDKWSNVPGSGCYSICYGTNLYRSTPWSIMSSTAFAYAYFNEVSALQVTKVTKRWVNLTIGSSSSNLNLNISQNASFSVTKANSSDPVTLKWYVQNTEQSSAINHTSFDYNFTSAGNYSIKCIASMGNLNETINWTARVSNPPEPASIIAFSPAENVTMNESSSQQFTVTANGSAPFMYSWKLDGTEKAATQNWTYNADYNSAGDRNITVVVSNSISEASHSWNVSVANVNRAPSISSSPVTAATENSFYQYNITASDPDGDSLNYTLETYPAGMTIASNTVSWTPNASHIGNNHVKIIVSDGSLNATQEYDINVTYENHAPVLGAVSDKITDENQQLRFNITAADSDFQYGDSITYSANSTLSVIKINNTLAEVIWTPTYNDAGVHYFILAAEDSKGAKDTKTVKITVNDVSVNHAPALMQASIPDITAYEGDLIVLNPSAVDSDNDTLTYTYAGWMHAGAKQTGYSDAGGYTVNVTVSDGQLSDSKIVGINVLNSYQIKMAISDKITKARLTGTVLLDSTGKQTTSASTATFDFIHAGEHSIRYSASGYKDNSYAVNFDNGLANCAQGSDCALISTSCKWNSQYSDFTCTLSNQFIFVFNPSENAIKRIDYLVK